MSEEIINRVKGSPLVTLDLEEVLDKKTERFSIDLKDYLFQGLVLKEKDFREVTKEHDWSQYKDAFVNIYCSDDAIIPNWAYMLLASKLSPYASLVVFGTSDELEKEVLRINITSIDQEQYRNGKLVIKGCSDLSHPEFAFTEITKHLTPYVSSLMYGEPCSTVPIYKVPKNI
ncbi:DUF2480 family protein [Marivirga sp. S37H4]|uniref:DUF2480 family protein n=1 Tax=Marivirga aurantiaca TaxID=2802615 RepID=A0A934X0J3_9BACT|nr:DUF2480 family protein [Marivirga aurantiaca]MBK6266669.1 DUF2480 family protein [Marivirga aurantiaca]